MSGLLQDKHNRIGMLSNVDDFFKLIGMNL